MILKSVPVLLLLLTLLVALSTVLGAERHTPSPHRVGRSVVMAPHGMVACSHPLAAQVGLDILKKGGTAVDAAIAVNAALGLMEPMMCGPGGDLFAIVWDAKGKNCTASTPAAGRRTRPRAYFADKGLDAIPDSGPLSWSVPGCVDGWDALHKHFGTLSLEQRRRVSATPRKASRSAR